MVRGDVDSIGLLSSRNSPDLLTVCYQPLDNFADHFPVWAASKEASFLHGRYIWANWDAEGLSKGAIRNNIEADPWYLEVGGIKG